jgi:hypothetical protein
MHPFCLTVRKIVRLDAKSMLSIEHVFNFNSKYFVCSDKYLASYSVNARIHESLRTKCPPRLPRTCCYSELKQIVLHFFRRQVS